MARPTENNPKGAQKSPTKTPEVLAKLEQAFALDCTVDEACLYSWIVPSTLYRWYDVDKELRERHDLLRNNPVLLARSTVVQAIKGVKNKLGFWEERPNVEIAMKYLERKKKNEFSTKVETENLDKVEINVSLNKEELNEAILNALQ